MSERFTIRGPETRQQAIAAVSRVPIGYTVTLAAPKRSSEQNEMLHGIIREWANTIPHPRTGQLMSVDQWKVILLKAFGAEFDVVPALNSDEVLAITPHTSALSGERCSDFIEWILAEAAHMGKPIKVAR